MVDQCLKLRFASVFASLLFGFAAACHGAIPAHPHLQSRPLPEALSADALSADALSADAHFAASWVLDAADHQGRPFAIVDKRAARIYVFDASGTLIGASPVLLGVAAGDAAVADIATRSPASLARHERTTPAGRFASEPGRNDKGEAIVWVDYDAAFAIHRLRAGAPLERRAERLASLAIDDKKISAGCVIVPAAFYDRVIQRGLGTRRGVVYVLPETRPVRSMFANNVALRSL